MSDLTHLQASLEQKRMELDRLEQELKQAQRLLLQNLAAQNGFSNTDQLIAALAEFASPEIQRALSQANAGGLEGPPNSHFRRPRRKRAKITDQQRGKLLTEIKKGKQTAAEIAEAFDVSTSTVNQMKQRFGLTRKRATAAS